MMSRRTVQMVCRVQTQTRWASLRSVVQSKELKEKEANLDDSLSRLSADVSQADKEWNDHILAKTGHADIDAKAQHANDVVAEMTEEEIEENKQIIKNMMIRGGRAFLAVLIGVSFMLYTYRNKRRELAERERAESSNEDVSVTLRKFSNAISDATVEKEDDDEEDAAPAK